MTDIVIVGAGPVGLWTAIQIKKRRPKFKIKLYERYREYQRSHVLRVRYVSMLLYAKNNHSKAEKDFFQAVAGTRSLTELFQKASVNDFAMIRTNDLEDALKAYAAKIGIEIEYKNIDHPTEVQRLHPECNTFVAADGTHSKMRTAVLGEDSVQSYPFQYVVEAKLNLKGAATRLSLAEVHDLNIMVTNTVFEYVGKLKNGITPATVRLFLDKEIYEAMPEATFKEPLLIEDERLPDSVRKDLYAYLNLRRLPLLESKISKLVLSLYKARQFAQYGKRASWFLVGDAAMGVPYFRSLNAGMIIGSQLGYFLTRRLVPNQIRVDMYNALQPLDIAWEFTGAFSKDLAIRGYDIFRKVCGKKK